MDKVDQTFNELFNSISGLIDAKRKGANKDELKAFTNQQFRLVMQIGEIFRQSKALDAELSSRLEETTKRHEKANASLQNVLYSFNSRLGSIKQHRELDFPENELGLDPPSSFYLDKQFTDSGLRHSMNSEIFTFVEAAICDETLKRRRKVEEKQRLQAELTECEQEVEEQEELVRDMSEHVSNIKETVQPFKTLLYPEKEDEDENDISVQIEPQSSPLPIPSPSPSVSSPPPV
ncbi:uncharacterized protein MONOS_17299 [Monocercomonoides exilis]|uniref:uncharacterized protein n=1 Tax=Monocercomonoides exilis TaxID=2049356 RepID=UPI00355A27CE|nr:hypothetical protein MONOS_17299 [Monocercomonoides exilis]